MLLERWLTWETVKKVYAGYEGDGGCRGRGMQVTRDAGDEGAGNAGMHGRSMWCSQFAVNRYWDWCSGVMGDVHLAGIGWSAVNRGLVACSQQVIGGYIHTCLSVVQNVPS